MASRRGFESGRRRFTAVQARSGNVVPRLCGIRAARHGDLIVPYAFLAVDYWRGVQLGGGSRAGMVVSSLLVMW